MTVPDDNTKGDTRLQQPFDEEKGNGYSHHQSSPSTTASMTPATMADDPAEEAGNTHANVDTEVAVCCGCRPSTTRKYLITDGGNTNPNTGNNNNNDDDDGSSFSRASFFRMVRRRLYHNHSERHESTNFFSTTHSNRDSPDQKRHRSSFKIKIPPLSFPTLRKKYFDAECGQDSEWYRSYAKSVSMGDAADRSESVDAESMYFFDALEDPLDDEEYPIDSYVVKSDMLGEYPIYFTTSLQHPAPHVSMDEPETMLKKQTATVKGGGAAGLDGKIVSSRSFSLNGGTGISSEEVWVAKLDAADTSTTMSAAARRKTSTPAVLSQTRPEQQRRNSEPIRSHREPSVRFLDIQRRPTLEHAKQLQEPRVKISLKGYPGELEMNELEECQKFLRGLRELNHSVTEQVYSFRDIEEEPYTICRWLRATKFDADKILQRLKDNQALFDEAKAQEFYPNIQEAIGAPLSVFLSQYPFIPVGRGKNGCPVNFFLAGKINPEGILCMTTIERLQSYFWYSFMWKFKHEIRSAQEQDPDFVRVEGINIIDLNGLSASAMTGETMEVIKLASKISDFFPETLHCMLVLNAPSFFAMSWGIIKKFIDPRTAARIQLFANRDKGLQALDRLVESSELPTDYGGGNMSLQEAFLREASDPALLRQNIELLNCKKRKGKSENISWTLEEGECMEVGLYTRSVSRARISVSFNDEIVTTVEAECSFEDRSSSESPSVKPLPRYILVGLCKSLVGPGTVTVQAEDLDTASKSHSGMSRGYFLIVGDVKLSSFEEEDE